MIIWMSSIGYYPSWMPLVQRSRRKIKRFSCWFHCCQHLRTTLMCRKYTLGLDEVVATLLSHESMRRNESERFSEERVMVASNGGQNQGRKPRGKMVPSQGVFTLVSLINPLYLEPVITTNNPDTNDLFFIMKPFQPFRAHGGLNSRSHVYLSQTTNLKITLHDTSAHERLTLLWLIEAPHQ
ncbi:hypothetical protein Vadar_005070 [Vaccinium darrowii]|uniref:Uncharacterized protein n=1 Tax=Vaccinium darrowii TaxID=229202 RepID=A0ACB7Y4W3_9ERIC|nr:hypothetical protein Vadar_005070 [Vaccinium darrowii]